MNKLISLLITKLKGEPYRVDGAISGAELTGLTLRRGVQAARGVFRRFFFRECRGLLFVGRGVRIRAPGRISAGRNLILEDGCYINALSRGGIALGDNVSFGRNCIVEMTGVIREPGESLEIGSNVGIAAHAFLGVRGRVVIGRNTILGPYVSLHSENHVFSDPGTPIRLQGAKRRGISIGEDCWIGAKATVLDGVSVGDGCVVAAGAVVTRDIPPFSVTGGVPARILKKRQP